MGVTLQQEPQLIKFEGLGTTGMFSDVHQFVRACLKCQTFAGRQKILALPFKPVQVEAPLQQWGLYFIG